MTHESLAGLAVSLRTGGLSAVLMFASQLPVFAAPPSMATIYSFAGGADGADPVAGLVADSSGALYGTTQGGGDTSCKNGCGTIFKLTPPTEGQTQWIKTVLHTFSGIPDGYYPTAKLVFDHVGNLYGTTVGGGQYDAGTVFSLTPPASGQSIWVKTVLHSFNVEVGDGSQPEAPVIFDKHGNLYGTAAGGGGTGFFGIAFRLQPPMTGQSQWTETVLHAFAGAPNDGAYPAAGMIMDSTGALYGNTTSGGACGSVYKLTPGATADSTWIETVLTPFNQGSVCNPTGLLHMDASGTLYDTVLYPNNGEVITLTPPTAGQTSWTQNTIYAFPTAGHGYNPESGVISDFFGKLYGTTAGRATPANPGASVFELVPPAVGQTVWTQKKLASLNGSMPVAGLLLAKNGKLYGTTEKGGANGFGSVFDLTR